MTESDRAAAELTPLRRLFLALKLSADAFNPDADDAGRLCVMMSLTAIDEFLIAMFGTREPSVLNPLHQLQYALYDLRRGKVMPLLKPKKVSRRPRDSAAVEGFRAFAAVAMDLYVQAKVPRKQAARDVAHELSRMGYKNGSGKLITGSRVEDWRDRMMTELPRENEAAARFHRVKAQLEVQFASDLKAGARFLLGRLPTVVPIPKKPRS